MRLQEALGERVVYALGHRMREIAWAINAEAINGTTME